MRTYLALLLAASSVSAKTTIGPAREISDYITGPYHTQAVDMDGDSDLDVIAGSEGGDRVLWWENDGSGRFTTRHDWFWDGKHGIMTVADANGDGHPDLWFKREGTGDGSGIWIGYGTPDGSFADAVKVLDETHEPSSAADVDRDGRVDLLSAGGIYFQKADGGFDLPPLNEDDDLPVDEYPGETAMGDFGGAGVSQFLSHDSNQIKRQKLMPDGSFGLRETVITLSSNESVLWMIPIPSAPGGARDRLLVGIRELEEIDEEFHESIRIALFVFDPDGHASELASTAGSIPGWSRHRFHDFFWDALAQRLLLTVPLSGSGQDAAMIAIDPGSSAISFTVFPFGGATRGISLEDFDGDGTKDLLFPLCALSGESGPSYSHLTWHKGIPGNQFETTSRAINQPAFASKIDHAGDIDNDGDGDVITSGGAPLASPSRGMSHEILVWRNKGTTFERRVVTDQHDFAEVIAVGDLNGDSLKDLLVRTYDYDHSDDERTEGIQRLIRYLQKPDGDFQVENISEEQLDSRDDLLAFTDWNNDGKKDLLFTIRSSGSPAITWRPATSAGGFGNPIELFHGSGSSITGVVDMDRDGDPDLIGNSYLFDMDGSFRETSFWLENDGTGAAPTMHEIQANTFPLGVDLDNDGFPDFTRDGVIYLSRPGVMFEETGFPTPGGDYMDLDHDGDLDAVVTEIHDGRSEFRSLGWLENLGGGRFGPSAGSGENGSGEFASRRISDVRYASRYEAAPADIDGDGTPDLVAISPQNRVEWFKITVGTAPVVFTSWMKGHDLHGESASPDQDWDGDGIANWSEFAFGSDPALADPGFPGRPRLISDAGGPRFTYQRRSDATSAKVSYDMSRSTDMHHWEQWNPPPQVNPASYGYEQVTFPITQEKAAEFFRVGVPGAP